MRRWIVLLLGVVIIAGGLAGLTSLLGGPTTTSIAPEEQPSPALHDLDDGYAMWPYYSAAEGSYDIRSSINVIVNDSVNETVAVLAQEDWRDVDPDEEDIEGGDFLPGEVDDRDAPTIDWGVTTGTDRFVYMEYNDEPLWLEEATQLQDGDYYGTRHHLRLYEPPTGSYTLIQGHYEHFDWFTLRHAVTSIEKTQTHVEQDLMTRLGQDRVWRIYLGNTGPYDADGWVTFVSLLLVPLIGAGLLSRAQTNMRSHLSAYPYVDAALDRLGWAHVVLVAAIIGLIFAIRISGVALERAGILPIKVIAGTLFLVLGFGLPAIVLGVSRRMQRRMDAAFAASGGLSAAILLEYLYLGVTVLPIEIIVHRAGVVTAVGLLAIGGVMTRQTTLRENSFLLAGLALYVLMFGLSLFGVL